jgi:hypothetical protein
LGSRTTFDAGQRVDRTALRLWRAADHIDPLVTATRRAQHLMEETRRLVFDRIRSSSAARATGTTARSRAARQQFEEQDAVADELV